MDVLTLTNAADAPFLNQQQAALERCGVRFETLSVAGDVTGENARGPLEYLQFFRTVRRELDREYDLIHAHYGLTAPMALAQRRVPVVCSLWGSDVHGPVAPVSRFCAPFCDEVIVMSEAMADALGRECRVIPDGVDLETFRPGSQAAARDRVGWPTDEHAVLFPYAPDRSVKNYPRAKRIVDRADGRLERPVSLRTITGVDHDEMPHYMNAADALLVTSHSEGSPNAVKEAMACDLPVVAVDVGDVRERLEGVSPSCVADADDVLVEGLTTILESGARSNGRKAAREVSLERTTDAVLEVYESVTGLERADQRRTRVARS
ncbi:glycosyltransferase [Natronosalvus caseinilyticus]|uniref:glycosyltransferase n=1 Tax=Natronosalvus caseinilyticus TaxID=2953747 RepID=UPI0028A7EA0F|nr:glycosyltransferase [Natronosalvus caseinilyticus]